MKDFKTLFKTVYLAFLGISDRIPPRKQRSIDHTLMRALYYADIGDMESAFARVKFVQRHVIKFADEEVMQVLN